MKVGGDFCIKSGCGYYRHMQCMHFFLEKVVAALN